MNEPIPRRRRHPHHVCIDCGVEWDGITAAPVAGEGLDDYQRGYMDGLHAALEIAQPLAANQPVAEERTRHCENSQTNPCPNPYFNTVTMPEYGISYDLCREHFEAVMKERP